jgi:hypothetical protein
MLNYRGTATNNDLAAKVISPAGAEATRRRATGQAHRPQDESESRTSDLALRLPPPSHPEMRSSDSLMGLAGLLQRVRPCPWSPMDSALGVWAARSLEARSHWPRRNGAVAAHRNLQKVLGSRLGAGTATSGPSEIDLQTKLQTHRARRAARIHSDGQESARIPDVTIRPDTRPAAPDEAQTACPPLLVHGAGEMVAGDTSPATVLARCAMALRLISVAISGEGAG